MDRPATPVIGSTPLLDVPRSPFADTADLDVYYPSVGHEAVRAEILGAVKTLGGLVVLTGEPGTGKTTALRRMIRDAEAEGCRVLECSVTAALGSPIAALARLLEVGDTPAPDVRREGLIQALRAVAPKEREIVVTIDEAQHLDRTEIEELRAFSDLATSSGLRLAIVLAGQPEQDLKLASLGLATNGRIYNLRATLPPLSDSEVALYVTHRLRMAGRHRHFVFQPDATERIANHAQGIPRIINQLCDAALRMAEQAGMSTISASAIDAAAQRLALPPLDRTLGREARHARNGQPGDRAGRTERERATPRGWLIAAVIGIATTTILITPRWTSSPAPPAVDVAASVTPKQPERPQPTAPETARGAPKQPEPPPALPNLDKPTPPETARIAAPAPPTKSQDRVEPRVASRPSAPHAPLTEGTSPVRPPPVPSATSTASPMALELLSNAEAGNLAKVQSVLTAGISPDVRDATGMTPLMMAVIHDHGAVAELLLARGANVNAPDYGGITALMLAANNGRTALLQRLINRGANLNERTRAGWTPLTYAAWNGYPAAVRQLLEAGANPALADSTGWTALQYARWRAADASRTSADATDSLKTDDPEPAEAVRLRYSEVINLLAGARASR